MTTTFISLYITYTYFWIESIYLLSINCKGKQNKENFELQKPVVDNNNAMNDDNNPNIAFPIWTPRVRTGSLPTKIGLRCSVTDNGGNCVKYDSCFVTLTHNVTLLLYYVAGQMSHYLLSTISPSLWTRSMLSVELMPYKWYPSCVPTATHLKFKYCQCRWR